MTNDITPSDPLSCTGMALREFASPPNNSNNHSVKTPKQSSSKRYSIVNNHTHHNDRNTPIVTATPSVKTSARTTRFFSPNAPSLHPSLPPNTNERNLVKRFNDEYKQSLIDQEIGTRARQESVRNITFFTVILFAVYLVIGCLYYSVWNMESQWTMEESLLFLIYTVTTVGYGSHDIPKSPDSRVMTIIFILAGIALVTVFFSEIFQYIVIKAARAQYLHDEENMTIRNLQVIESHHDDMVDTDSHSTRSNSNCVDIENQSRCHFMRFKQNISKGKRRGRALRSVIFDTYSWFKNLAKHTMFGQCFIILLPFSLLLLVGSIVVGLIEGWSAIDSFYWAVVTLTTVGTSTVAVLFKIDCYYHVRLLIFHFYFCFIEP